MLTSQLKLEIKKHALSKKEEEICGLLIIKDNIIKFYKCENISYHKKNHCILNPLDYVRASEEGKVIAHVHSQPDRNPSFTDYLNAINHNLYSIVYSTKYNKFSIIEPKLKEYLNIDYDREANNCFELIRNYYKNELNIFITKYKMYNENEEDKFKYILSKYKREGFYKVNIEDIRMNDIILFNIARLPHLSIYISNNFILHHPQDEKSIVDELSTGLKKRINIILRHKDFKNE